GKENGVNILKSIDEGSFQMGLFGKNLLKELKEPPSRETNILLQGLPKDIYTLINHYTDAKDIWDNVKMLLEGSELTKEDQETQMYTSLKQRNIRNADIGLSQSLYISLKFYVEDIDWKH
nr:hypothetical protein [Tanacetum cinerariifolium]